MCLSEAKGMDIKMKKRTGKKRFLNMKVVNAMALFALTMSSVVANGCCVFIYHQTKVPKELEKLRKF